ncbi:acyl-CoA reductase [Clostridium sp. MB40-C1]|uniref:acyl-CoA reductase n=1 Tax=Clostridium sp. MB40-C1 TaxID=3070996 RepID=UPI0027E10FBE|nr:acyl-CoA reductase [Clostridium sp. MB40-C1]WMJ82382.1 acyl-CoA reductase [Clostridium sp. MB40-C1]
MIKCYMLDGQFYEDGIVFEEFDQISGILKLNNKKIASMPIEALMFIMDKYSKRLSSNKDILRIEGVPYLSFYLKKNNINKLLRMNFDNTRFLDDFIEIDEEKYLKAQPRGTICHWIAGNVPTLSIYSAFHGILSKNANLLRIPQNSIVQVIDILKLLDDIEVQVEGNVYSSKDLLKNICIVYFESENKDVNSSMSLLGDGRIVWGGEEAVNAITTLPKKTTCKDLIFGPKYSFAVFDKEALEGQEIDKYLENLVMDIIAFDQKACSSPQVLFVEKSTMSIDMIAKKLACIFQKINRRYPNNNLEQYVSAKIINKRGEYGLSLEKSLYCSKGLDYTILLDDQIKLEEPVQGRTIFLKEVSSVFDVVNLITPRIQCVGIAFKNTNKTLEFSDEITKMGVDRVTKVGYMNLYDFPWDGSLVLNELVRWCSINVKGMLDS